MPFNKIQSAGFDLTDNYAFTGTVSGAGDPAFVFLGESKNSSAANNGTVDNIFSDTYHLYFFQADVLVATNGTHLMAQLVNSGTATTANYYYSFQGLDQGGNSESGDSSGAASAWSLSGANSNSRPCQVIGYISGTTSGESNHKKVSWQCATFDVSNNQKHVTGGGFQTSSTDHTGFKLLAGSGDLTKHSIQIYGVSDTEKFGGF